MTLGVSNDLDTGDVAVVYAAAKAIDYFFPSKAHQLAAHLRATA
jgi:hypothetical protein